MKGEIRAVIGPMFSGKSQDMILQVRQGALGDVPALIVKFRGDNRYGAGAIVSTHADVRQGSTPGTDTCAGIRVVEAERLAEVEVLPHEYIIGVDEGQFYPDLVEHCRAWADQGRRVIVAALDGDFCQMPFPVVSALIPHCEKTKKKRGVCMSCRAAKSAFSRRIVEGDALVDIGGADKYIAVCRACLHKTL